MARVSLNSLSKVYDNDFNAIKDVSLDIEDGEFVVLVGPSGCGKSTLLRMIAGLESITSGQLHIGDKLSNCIRPGDRDIAMVFQNYALYPHMTVRQNLSFGLESAGKSRKEILARVYEAAEILEISDILERKPGQLSGGQCQRAALGRALVRKPAVFLLDEPLSNLDARLRVTMRQRISLLHQQLKQAGQPATMIYVTHDQSEAMTMGDKICVLERGKVVQTDSPATLYNHPRNRFVAEFLGNPAMNTLPCTLIKDSGRFWIQCKGRQFMLPDRSQQKVRGYESEKILWGIRPEHIVIEYSGEAVDGIAARICFIENMGAEFHVYCDVGGVQIVVRLANEICRFQRGDQVSLHPVIGKSYFSLAKQAKTSIGFRA